MGRFVILNDLIDAEEQEDRPVRRFYRRENAFELTDEKFIKTFRLTKLLVRNLILLLTPFLQAPIRSSAITIELKVTNSIKSFLLLNTG